MPSAELGPIWRSVRRHRAFALLVVEVALGFFIIASIMMTSRWYAAHARPTSGHREADVFEVVTRGPAKLGAPDGEVARRRREELTALEALPGVRRAVAVTSSSVDDRWELPYVFWTDAGVARGPSRCQGVSRSADGVVVGWPAGAGPGLAEAVDLQLVEGTTDGVLITRCLRDALFGDAPAVGRTLHSNAHAPAPIAGVVEDVRLHVALLDQTKVTAIYPLGGVAADPRVDRFVVRADPGHDLRGAVGPALARVGGPGRIVSTQLFDEGRTNSAGIACGAVLLLVYVGGLLGVLAIMGNIAVAAFLVRDRRRIIAMRRALGASRADIMRYLIIENLLPTQLGNLLGFLVVLASLPAAKLHFSGIHFDIIDALGTAFLLSLGGLLARLIPALRATRIPPSVVTRSL